VAVAHRRQREKEARRQAILDAAERLMAARGLWCLTMDDVAQEAELSKGALYLYFENKDALLAAIASRSVDELIPRLEAELEAARSGLDGLRRAYVLYAAFMREHPHLFRMALGWMLSGVQADEESPALVEYRARVADIVGRMVGAVERGQTDGTVRPDVEPLYVAMEIWGGFLGVMLLELNRDDLHRRFPFVVDVDRIVPGYVETALRGLQGPAVDRGDL
jgi:AcrR family transcriptional regulator